LSGAPAIRGTSEDRSVSRLPGRRRPYPAAQRSRLGPASVDFVLGYRVHARRVGTGEVAAQAAVNPQTLRDYERRGMLAAPARTDSGYRAYPVSAVRSGDLRPAPRRAGLPDPARPRCGRSGAAADRSHRPGRGQAMIGKGGAAAASNSASEGAVRIELLVAPDCPHASAARSAVAECLDQLRLDVRVRERVGEYPSPTVLVDGVDVMTDGRGAPRRPACRLDLPTTSRIRAALLAECTTSTWSGSTTTAEFGPSTEVDRPAPQCHRRGADPASGGAVGRRRIRRPARRLIAAQPNGDDRDRPATARRRGAGIEAAVV
jgi:MerR family regulatory protein